MAQRRVFLILVGFLLGGCASVGLPGGAPGGAGNVGKTCTAYREEQIRSPYCAQMAAQTCDTNSAGQRSCFGGGYCVRTDYQTLTVKTCTAYECAAGLIRAEGGCFTSEQLDERKAWRAERALGIVARRNKLSRRDPDTLVVVSSAFQYGRDGLPKDPQLAFEYAERSCGGGSGRGCGLLSGYYRRTEGEPLVTADGNPLRPDFERADALETQACELGSRASCFQYGKRLLADLERLTEAEQSARLDAAIAFFDAACPARDGVACGAIAELYLAETLPSENPARRAAESYARGCAGKDRVVAALNCREAAVAYYNGGLAFPADPGRAKQLATRGQALDERSDLAQLLGCISQGREFCGLTAEAIDEQISADLADSGRGAEAEALLEEAKRINRLPKRQKGKRLLRREEEYALRACDLGLAGACYFYGQLLWYSDMRYPGLSEDERGAARAAGLEYYEKACSLNYPWGCWLTGKQALFTDALLRNVQVWFDDRTPIATNIHPEADLPRAFDRLGKACDLGHTGACRSLAAAYLTREKTSHRNPAKALLRYEQGCDQGDVILSVSPCLMVARLLYNGTPTLAPDRPRALANLKAAEALIAKQKTTSSQAGAVAVASRCMVADETRCAEDLPGL
ncbi:MAG: hypothetical protein AAF648_09990 [Pseudomonadota bacterium]